MSTLSLFPLFLSNSSNKMANRVVLDPKCEDVVVSSSSPSLLSVNSSPTDCQSSRSLENVRRCLFGRSDSHENRRFAREELRKISIADQSRWNFDFVLDAPLPGRYDWQLVDSPSTTLPEPYKPVASLPSTSKPVTSRRALKISDITKANARRNLTFEPIKPAPVTSTRAVEDKLAEAAQSIKNNEQEDRTEASPKQETTTASSNDTTTKSSSCESSPSNLQSSQEEAIITVIPKTSKPSKQTTMTDFMKIRKRRCEESKPEVTKKLKREEETV